MENVEGPTLDAYARSRGGSRLALDEALSLLDSICLGVAAIHASGVIHRDIKPSNILVGPALRVVVADLGIARKLADDDRPGPRFSGTPAYVAPEVALRRALDPALLPRIDVYALGLIAYWLLAGQLPFEGKSERELLEQHAYQPPPRPSALRPDLPPSFDAPLLAALAKDPAERTESAEAFREALLAARDDAPSSQKPRRVVVADDDPAFREFLAHLLQVALPGARVEAVADGAAAFAAIRRDPPALGVFDLDMPGLDGIELTAAVRALPRGGDFPILVATGTGGAAEWQRLARLGASAFLVKPFDAGQLITLARGLVGIALRDAPARSARS
jgi:serine/threonine-protein kinase